MREQPVSKRLCGGFGYAIGSRGKSVKVPLLCGRWDCPECGAQKRGAWLNRIRKELPGAVLYTTYTKLSQKALSKKVRRNIEKGRIYFCVHMNDGAIVFSNAKFEEFDLPSPHTKTDAKPKNKRKFLEEIRELMESGKVTNISRRKDRTEKDKAGAEKIRSDAESEDLGNDPPIEPLHSFARITEKIFPEHGKCKSDYEIGQFLLGYLGTDNIRSLTKRGKELLRKIKTGEINAESCNLGDLE